MKTKMILAMSIGLMCLLVAFSMGGRKKSSETDSPADADKTPTFMSTKEIGGKAKVLRQSPGLQFKVKTPTGKTGSVRYHK